MLVAKVEASPGKAVVNGRFELRFAVKLNNEEDGHEFDEDEVDATIVSCKWTAGGSYECDSDLLARTLTHPEVAD